MLENVLFKGLKKPKEKKIKKIQQSYKIEGEDLNLLNSFKDLKVKTIFESPKLVQQIVIPYILKDKNICVQSFTGSGKLLSYLLPLVELSFKKNVKAIVLVPNDQLKEQVKRVLKYEIISENKAEIIILRPDEILKHGDNDGKDKGSGNGSGFNDDKGNGSGCNDNDNGRVNDNNNNDVYTPPLHSLNNITHLIIDEADLMIHKDFLNLFKSLSSILNSCTVSVFSATLNREVEKILGIFKDFTKIYVSNKGSISHKFVFGTKDQIKHLSLEQIIEEGVEVPCLVFVNNNEIGNKLSERIPRSAFFDNTSSSSSNSLLDDFRLKKIWFLFTTDILSRGVDFINTKSVINYDFPRNKTIFIHRAGRVNRNTTGQKVITIYTVEDFKKLKEIVEILKENGSRVEEHIEKLYK